jgi:hypothetical protein
MCTLVRKMPDAAGWERHNLGPMSHPKSRATVGANEVDHTSSSSKQLSLTIGYLEARTMGQMALVPVDAVFV